MLSWSFTNIEHPIAPNSTKDDRLAALKGLLIDHYLFFVVFYYGVKTIKDALFVFKVMLILIYLTTIITVIDVYDIPDLGIIKQMEHESAYNRGRVQGPLGEPNQYASFLVLYLPAYIGLTMLNKGLSRYFYLSAVTVTFVVLLLTGSRGGVAGLLLGAILATISLKQFIKFKHIASVTIKAVIIGSLGLAVVLYKYSELILGRVDATTGTKDATTASAGRLWIWEQGFNKMTAEPISFLVGEGWNTYAGYVGIVSHNTFFTVLFEFGALGLIPYLLLIFMLIKINKQGMRTADKANNIVTGSFIFGFYGLLISVFFVNLFNPWVFIWGYIGLMTRVAVLSRLNDSKPEKPAKPLLSQIKTNLQAKTKLSDAPISAT